MSTKIERTKEKLAELRNYFKKDPGCYRFTNEEAMITLVEAIQYMLFLMEESGLNDKNKNDFYSG